MPEEIQTRVIQEEMKDSYIDYAMSVITARALPNVYDGLKPVHRRILYAMHEMGLTSNKPTMKSARICGETMGKYHPHGNLAVYDSLVRMAQDFSLRYPLVKGQGNFGCFTGDTKIKLLDGTSKSFKELCKIYKDDNIFYVYSIDKEGKVVIGEAKNPRITKREAKIIEVILDTGDIIRCTPDHKFLLKDWTYKEAKDLTSNDSIMPGIFTLSPIRGNTELKEYLMIKDNRTEEFTFVHEIVDDYNLKTGVYTTRDGPVRHHVDFNKFNNNPENIKRLSWKEHSEIHNDHIKNLWKDPEFRKKQAEGVRRSFQNNLEHKEKIRKIVIARNKDKDFIKRNKEKRNIWYNESKRKENSERRKKYYEDHPEKRKTVSIISKKRWSDPIKRQYIIKRMHEVMGLKGPRKVSNRHHYANPSEAKKAASKRSKDLWKDPNYFSKFVNANYNHFSAMAKKAWQDKKYQKLQSTKAKELWKNDHFRETIITGIKRKNAERLKENPDYMKELAKKSAVSHRKNWKNESYKNNIIRNKILYYLNRLIPYIGEENINEHTYNYYRPNNCFPRFDNAIKHFESMDEMIEQAKNYNHYVVEIKFIDYTEDVYDITVNEHHNFLLDCGVFVHNSVDGFSAAADRYTEAKMTKLAEEMLEELDKETVPMGKNYDNSLDEPLVLPSKIPNLLVNGSSGIAVGMATNIPPHNMAETISAIIAMIDNPEINIQQLLEHINGPDFPTGGIISGISGMQEAYAKGKGKIIVKAKTKIEDRTIVITEIPYQLNKTMLIESIAELVREKRIEGISDIRDESAKDIRIVIKLKKDFDPEIILNQLYAMTSLKISYGIIMIALHNGQPKLMNLKEIIQAYIEHRKNVVTRRTKFDLRKAEERKHVVEGLKIAIENIDTIIALIKKSLALEEARQGLINNYKLSEIQANAILDMKLSKLTSLETDKLKNEHEELINMITELQGILSSEPKIFAIIKKELEELREKYGDERRTLIEDGEEKEIISESLVQEEDVVITLTQSGYIKQLPLAEYRQQKRGGKGVIGTGTKEEDAVKDVFITSNRNYLLFFTNKGRIHWLKAYEIPEGSRYSLGKSLANVLHLIENEKVSTILPVASFKEGNLFFVTRNGIVKRTKLEEFSNPRKGGIVALNLKDNDELITVLQTKGSQEVIIASENGQAVRFNEEKASIMGRQASGVRGMHLVDDKVIGAEVVAVGTSLLTITEKGYGKRTAIEDYRLTNRGGIGVTNIKITEKNGKVAGILSVTDEDGILCMTEKGQAIRINAKEISVIGRNTQGVRIMKVEDDKVNAVAKV